MLPKIYFYPHNFVDRIKNENCRYRDSRGSFFLKGENFVSIIGHFFVMTYSASVEFSTIQIINCSFSIFLSFKADNTSILSNFSVMSSSISYLTSLSHEIFQILPAKKINVISDNRTDKQIKIGSLLVLC